MDKYTSHLNAENITKLVTWFIKGEVGLSSKTIAAAIAGVSLALDDDDNDFYPSIPYDPPDFRRCHLLLEAIPEFRQKLHLVSEAFPEWKPYIDNWSDLTGMYLANIANKQSRMDDLYGVMKLLEADSNKIKRASQESSSPKPR